MEFYLVILIVFLFSSIHFLEFSSFYSRIAGIRSKKKLLSYSIQQTTFVGTRFFFIFLMPLLGYIVDRKVDEELYIYMIFLALAFASLGYIFSYLFKETIVTFFENVILEYSENKRGYITSFLISLSSLKYRKNKSSINNRFKFFNKNIVILSAIVFCCYSIAVFLSFYLALIYYDYRSTISQLSGLVNAAATLLLTLYVEPKISRSIDDNSNNVEYDIYSLLLGRFLGVAILSPLIVILVNMI